MTRTYHDVGLIIAAAGSSRRYGQSNKLFETLDGRPLFLHSMQCFWQVIPRQQTVLVIDPEEHSRVTKLLEQTVGSPFPLLVPGGATRAESVLRGLKALPAAVPLVAIQDAARPLSSLELLCSCLESARQHGSGVAARRVTDTIKLADTAGVVQQTLDRAALWAAETPQVLQAQHLRIAYAHALANPQTVLTDDASAIEAAGQPIHLVEALQPNPKVTYRRDLDLLRAWLASRT